jgi:hypothetical protein
MQASTHDVNSYLAGYTPKTPTSTTYPLSNPSTRISGNPQYHISKLRRADVPDTFFQLFTWRVDFGSVRSTYMAALQEHFSSEDACARFIQNEIRILDSFRSVIVYLNSQFRLIDEVQHLQKLYILYKTGLLSRLAEAIAAHTSVANTPQYIVAANETNLAMRTKVHTANEEVTISGSADVFTVTENSAQVQLSKIRTVEELKVSGRTLRRAAAQAKDQSLFETTLVAEMRRSVLRTEDDFLLSCLTDFFSIRIAALVRTGEDRRHYLAPSRTDSETFVLYQLILHLLSPAQIKDLITQTEKGVTLRHQSAKPYADSCDEAGENDEDNPSSEEPLEDASNNLMTSKRADLRKQCSRGGGGSGNKEKCINFKAYEEAEMMAEKIRQTCNWDLKRRFGPSVLSEEHLRQHNRAFGGN